MATRILAIDDEPSVTRMIKLNLEATGNYEVRMVNDAREALRAALEFRPNVVLLDVMMPELDGGQVSDRLSADPDLCKVPIVYLTAVVTRSDLGPNPLYSGGNRVIAKPITTEELVRTIEDARRSRRRTSAGHVATQ